MSCKITVTRRFEKEVEKLAKEHSFLATDLRSLREELQENSRSGTSLGKGCCKIRPAIRSKGKGKNGAARVITYVFEGLPEQTNLVLMNIYDKSDIDPLSDQQIAELVAQIEI